MNTLYTRLSIIALSLIGTCHADYTTYTVEETVQPDKVRIKETRITYRREAVSSWEPVFYGQTTYCSTYHKPCCCNHSCNQSSDCHCCCHDNCHCTTCTTHVQPCYEWRTHYIDVPEYHYSYHLLDLVPAIDFGLNAYDYSIIFHALDKIERLGDFQLLHNQLERLLSIEIAFSYITYDRLNGIINRMERTGYTSDFKPLLECLAKNIHNIVICKKPRAEFIEKKEHLKNVRTGSCIAAGAIALGSVFAYLSGAISKEACIATTTGCALTAGASTALPSLAPSYRKHIESLSCQLDKVYISINRVTQSRAFVNTDHTQRILDEMHAQAALITNELA